MITRNGQKKAGWKKVGKEIVKELAEQIGKGLAKDTVEDSANNAIKIVEKRGTEG